MYSASSVAKALLTAIFAVALIDAYSTYVPYGICETFEIGHPYPDERSDATVTLQLLQGEDNVSKSCFKPKETYKLKITIKSNNPDKKIMGIMAKPSNGKFDVDKSSPATKLRLVGCEESVISHMQKLYANEVTLHYASPKSKRRDVSFRLWAVFAYKDYVYVEEAFPPCPDDEKPSTPSPTTTTNVDVINPTSTITSIPTTPTITSTSISTTLNIFTTSAVPYFTPTPTTCPDIETQPTAVVCGAEKSVKKLYEVRHEVIAGGNYQCISASTLRFFTCGSCISSSTPYTCKPRTTEGTRLYNCTLLDTDNTALPSSINKRFRNLSIQNGCTCCETTVE